MLTFMLAAEGDNQTLSLVDYAGPPRKILRGEGSHVPRPIGDISVDCALHLETSAAWGQAVTVTLEFYAADEARSEPGPGWVLDGEGIFPRRSNDPLYVGSELLEAYFFDIDIPVDDHRFEAWVAGREENRAAIAAWETLRYSSGGQWLPWEEASKTVPASLERWLIRLIST